MANFQEYKKGNTRYAYDPLTGEGIAFADPTLRSQYFASPMGEVPDLAVDPTPFNQAPGKVISGVIDESTRARAAAQAGMSFEDYSKLLQGDSGVTAAERTTIDQNLGIPDLEKSLFSSPSRTSEQIYQDAFNAAGLADIKKQFEAKQAEVNAKKQELNERLAKIDENPWKVEATRGGAIAREKAFYEGTIANLEAEAKQFADMYNNGIAQVNNVVSRTTTDLQNDRALKQAQLQYLQAKAEQAATALGQEKYSKVSRYLPEFLQASAKAKKPETIGSDKTGYYKWNPATGTFQQVIAPVAPEDDTSWRFEPLSPAEAEKLGVPFGTTKGEAANAGIIPQKQLSAEAQKLTANVTSGLKSLGTMKKELFKDANENIPVDQLNNVRTNVLGRAALPFKFAGTYTTAEREIKDVLVRMRTGAAISKEEEEYYQKQLPSIYDNEATVKYKLKMFEDLFNTILPSRLQGMGTTDDSLFQEFENGGANKTSLKAPSSSRTDRHLNPTAFTTDIARIAGLKEGVDYIKGDPFSNGRYYTAKLLQDPVETTIKVIDRIGFYTESGNQRWSHTAMPKSQWDELNHAQKVAVIEKMYKNENGGKSSLSNFYA